MDGGLNSGCLQSLTHFLPMPQYETFKPQFQIDLLKSRNNKTKNSTTQSAILQELHLALQIRASSKSAPGKNKWDSDKYHQKDRPWYGKHPHVLNYKRT